MAAVGMWLLGAILAGGAAGLGILYWTHDKPDVPGVRPYRLLVAIETAWCFLYVILLLTDAPVAMRVLDMLITICSVSSAFVFVAFVLDYTGRSEWLEMPWIGLLALEPLAYLALYTTDPFHGLVFTETRIVEAAGLSLFEGTFTIVPVVQILVIYLVLALAFGLLGKFVLRSHNLYRKQSVAIFAGTLLPTLGTTIWLFTRGTAFPFDLTPVVFALRFTIIGVALFKYDFLDVTPLASDVLIDELGDPLFVIDEEGTLVDYNRRAQQVFGLDESTIGESVPDDLEAVMTASDAGHPVTVETDPRASGGQEATYQPSATELRDQHDIVRGQLILLQDITTQKQRERTLSTLQAGSRDLLAATSAEEVAGIATRTATEVFPYPFVGIFLATESGDALRAASVSGPVVSELGDTDTEIRIDDGPLWEAFRGGTTGVFQESDLDDHGLGTLPLGRALVYPLGDHGVFWIGAKTTDPFDSDDQRFGELLALNVRAALDRAEREAELDRQRAELRRQNDRLDEFAGMVSHDLRNPLSTAASSLALARSDPEPEHFDRVERAHDRMDQLIDEVLTYAKEGTQVEDVSTVSLGAIARRAWETAGERAARLVIADDPVVEADPERLRTLFENLFRNAREHGPADVTVTVRASAADGQFSVGDDGPGIDPADRETVFDRGHTTSSEGTGMGLSIVREIAHAHGWSVRAGESPSGGAMFVFEDVELSASAESESAEE